MITYVVHSAYIRIAQFWRQYAWLAAPNLPLSAAFRRVSSEDSQRAKCFRIR